MNIMALIPARGGSKGIPKKLIFLGIMIDFEGYFPKLFGILVSDMIFQFYIKSRKCQPELYEVIFKALNIVKEFYYDIFRMGISVH